MIRLISTGLIKVNPKKTSFKGIWELGCIEPFNLGDSAYRKGPFNSNIEIHEADKKIVAIRKEIADITRQIGKHSFMTEFSWSGTSVPTDWHMDCNGIRINTYNTVFIANLTSDPHSLAGTQFTDATRKTVLFQATTWHLYMVPYLTWHRGVNKYGEFKAFLRFYVKYPQEVLDEIQN